MESRDSTWTLDVDVLQAAARPYSKIPATRFITFNFSTSSFKSLSKNILHTFICVVCHPWFALTVFSIVVLFYLHIRFLYFYSIFIHYPAFRKPGYEKGRHK